MLPAKNTKITLPKNFHYWATCLSSKVMTINNQYERGETGGLMEGQLVITEIVNNTGFVAHYSPARPTAGALLPECKIYVEDALAFFKSISDCQERNRLIDFLK